MNKSASRGLTKKGPNKKELPITIRFSLDLKERIDVYSSAHYQSFNGAVLDLVTRCLDREANARAVLR